MPTSEHSLYSKIVMGMQDYAGQVGYDIITAVSYSTSTAETRQMNMLFNRTVDGVILLGTQYDADSLNKLAENYNVALCCEGVKGANVLTVAVDDEQAAFDAVAALIKRVIKDRLYRNELFGYFLHCKRERLYKSIKRIWHRDKE